MKTQYVLKFQIVDPGYQKKLFPGFLSRFIRLKKRGKVQVWDSAWHTALWKIMAGI
jgi:hypothetical protein